MAAMSPDLGAFAAGAQLGFQQRKLLDRFAQLEHPLSTRPALRSTSPLPAAPAAPGTCELHVLPIIG